MNSNYANFIKEELGYTDSTTADYRSRSLTIVTTSGGLVTLLAGLIAVASGGSKTWVFPTSARGPLAVALSCFVLAAVLALLVHLPRNVKRATTEGLKALLTAADPDAEALDAIAEVHFKTLKSLRRLNGQLAWFLLLAIALETVAIGATGWTAWRIIDSL